MTADILDDLRALEEAREAFLPEEPPYPLVIAWIVTRDGRFSRQFDAARGDADREFKLFKILPHKLKASEISAAIKDIRNHLRAGLLRASACQGRAEPELVQRLVWRLEGTCIEGCPDHGSVLMCGNPVLEPIGTEVRFDRDEVLALWPPKSACVNADDPGAHAQTTRAHAPRRATFSLAQADEPLVERALTLVRERKISANRAAQCVVDDGKEVAGGGTRDSKVTRIAKRVSERLHGSTRS